MHLNLALPNMARNNRSEAREEDITTTELREQTLHNFLESWVIHDLLYKVDTEKLRRVQQKTHVALLRMLFMWIDEWYIKLPTGTGKTLFFTEILYALQLAAVLKAPTVDLTAQNLTQLVETWYENEAIFSIPSMEYDETEHTFKKLWNCTAKETLEHILEEIKEKLIDNPVVWSTYASLKSLFKNSPDLLDQLNHIAKVYISDEAHETMGNVWKAMKEYFMDREHGNPYGKMHILLTATPDRRKKSLKDSYHEIISIKLQECFEDEILIRPWFDGVGKAYLPIRGGIEKKPSVHEIESSWKFIDSTWRPIREVVVDKYAELLKKHVYFPGKFFCTTIKEAKDIERYAREVHGIRTMIQTSETQVSDAEISKMIYNDEIDVVVNVKMWVQGSDCRPLRCAARFNASNDPVFKTQGNGRIMRTMREEDVEEIFKNVRNRSKYSTYSDEQLKEIIRKSTDNTRIIEPDKWVLTVPKKWRLPVWPKWMWKKRKQYIPTKDDPIDELPNSLEDMFLCDEVDSSYLAQHYPNATVHFTDIKEFFEQEKISSLEELLVCDKDLIRSKAADRFRGSKFQKIDQMLSVRSLAWLNAVAEFMSYPAMSQQQFNKMYNDIVKKTIKPHSIVTLYDYFSNPWLEGNPASFLVWSVKHEEDIWEERSFVELTQRLGVNIQRQIKQFLGTTNPVKLLLEWEEKLNQIFDLINNIRKSQGLPVFPHGVKKEKIVAYLAEYCNFDSLKDYFHKHLQKIGITTVEQAFPRKNRQTIVHKLQEVRQRTIAKEMGIYAGYIYGDEFRRAFLRYMYGKEAADDVIYKNFIEKLKKKWTIYTIFDLLNVLHTHYFWQSRDIRFYFSNKLDDIPVDTLVKFAKIGVKHGLIQTDDIDNIRKDIELHKKSHYKLNYTRRKNKLERVLGVDLIRKQKENERKEQTKKDKMQAQSKKKDNKKAT